MFILMNNNTVVLSSSALFKKVIERDIWVICLNNNGKRDLTFTEAMEICYGKGVMILCWFHPIIIRVAIP